MRCRFKTLKEATIKFEGPKVFNSLPKHLRDFKGTLDNFKNILDKFLENIPDQPNGYRGMIPTIVDNDCKPTNKLKDWIAHLNLKDWTPPHLVAAEPS